MWSAWDFGFATKNDTDAFLLYLHELFYQIHKIIGCAVRLEQNMATKNVFSTLTNVIGKICKTLTKFVDFACK